MSLLESDLSHETCSGSLQLLRQVSQLRIEYESGGRHGSEKVTHCLEHRLPAITSLPLGLQGVLVAITSDVSCAFSIAGGDG